MPDRRPPRRPRRLTAALAAAVAVLLLAGCSSGNTRYPHMGQYGGWTDGSPVRTVLLFVLLPLAIAGVLAALAVLPGARRRYRYRPQEGWSADPVWFAGPPDPVAAVAEARPEETARGGAGGSW